MCLNPVMQTQHKKPASAPLLAQQGSALVMAIFLILLMSALILFLGRQLFSSSVAVSYEVQGNRAFNAAQSGLQLGLVQLFPLSGSSSCASVNTSTAINFDAHGAFAAVPGLVGCSASLTCTKVDNPDNTSRPLFRLESSAVCIAGDIQTSRVVQMEAY